MSSILLESTNHFGRNCSTGPPLEGKGKKPRGSSPVASNSNDGIALPLGQYSVGLLVHRPVPRLMRRGFWGRHAKHPILLFARPWGTDLLVASPQRLFLRGRGPFIYCIKRPLFDPTWFQRFFHALTRWGSILQPCFLSLLKAILPKGRGACLLRHPETVLPLSSLRAPSRGMRSRFRKGWCRPCRGPRMR